MTGSSYVLTRALVRRAQVPVAHAGGLAHCNPVELNQALHRNINSSRAYRPPVELARALFAAIFNSPARPVNAAEDKPGS